MCNADPFRLPLRLLLGLMLVGIAMGKARSETIASVAELKYELQNRPHPSPLPQGEGTRPLAPFSPGRRVGDEGMHIFIQQRPIAQTVTPDVVPEAIPISFVATNEVPSVHTVRRVPGYPPRFSDAVGSGGLVLNGRTVTGYYLTVSNLDTRTSYAYHFHAALHNGTPTSCEGDKALFTGEAQGAVILDLGSIAPLQPSRRGVAMIGSPSQPIALPHPIPLAEIGYLNIHPIQNEAIEPGIICANVRLNPGGFVR